MDKLNNRGEMRIFTMQNGDVRAWIEQEAIHMKVIFRSSRDPVELTENEARRLAAALIDMANQIEQND